MGYIENNLLDDETILYSANLHWIIFKWTIFWCLLIPLALSSGEEGIKAVPGALMFAAISGILAFLNYKASEFGLTNKRLLMKTGILRRNSAEVLLTKVEGIQVSQSILGRMLGYGTVIVSGTGGLREVFKRIANPLEFRKNIQEQTSNIQNGQSKTQIAEKPGLCIHCGKYYEGSPSFCPNCGKPLEQS